MAQTISATDVELPAVVNAVFNQTFLRRAQQMCPYFMGSQPGTLVKNGGSKVINWRRIDQETPSTTALTELTSTSTWMQGRDADTPSFSTVTATVAKYGQFYILNEEVDLFSPNAQANELVAVLGESAGRSLNQLQRNLMEDNATQRYAANVASTGAVHAIIAAGDLNRIINELMVQAARPFTAMTSGSANIGTAPILPAFWAISHPDVAHDIAGISGFTSVEKYGQQTAIVMGEFGYYSRAGVGIRFCQSQDASKDANTGAALSGADLNSTGASVADTYCTVIFGQDAFGSVGLGKRHTDGAYRAGDNTGGWEMIHKAAGSAGAGDPFDEISTIAWKAWYAGAVLNANWSRGLRTAATNLAN